MSENLHAVIDADGAVLQVVVWDGVTPWPAPEDAKAMADRALREVQSQGLTATGAGQALRSIAETAVDVAEKAISGKAVPLSPR